MGYTDGMTYTSIKQVRSNFEESLSLAEQATWVPVPITRPEKGEGGKAFELVSEYQPAGDQPEAIAELVTGVEGGERDQVLLGVTGSVCAMLPPELC